jgi:hypothetical protein
MELQVHITMPGLFIEIVLANILPRLVLNSNPPKLYLLRSWKYTHEPPCLAFVEVLI